MMSLKTARNILGTFWFAGFAILMISIIYMTTVTSLFSTISKETYSWFIPLTVPTLSLMVSVFAVDAISGNTINREINRFYFLLTLLISLLYLLSIASVYLLIPFYSVAVDSVRAKDIMSTSNYYLGPLQALSTGLLVIFFKK